MIWPFNELLKTFDPRLALVGLYDSWKIVLLSLVSCKSLDFEGPNDDAMFFINEKDVKLYKFSRSRGEILYSLVWTEKIEGGDLPNNGGISGKVF